MLLPHEKHHKILKTPQISNIGIFERIKVRNFQQVKLFNDKLHYGALIIAQPNHKSIF